MVRKLAKQGMDGLERYSLGICSIFFVLGIVMSELNPSIGGAVSHGIDAMLSAYAYVVPFILYLLVVPAMLKLFELHAEYGQGILFSILGQFVAARILAILFVIICLSALFGLPIQTQSALPMAAVLKQAVRQLIYSLISSPLLWGVYAAITTAALSCGIPKIKSVFDRVGNSIEAVGRSFVVLSPLFMFAVGSFLHHLPTFLQENLAQNSSLDHCALLKSINLNILWLNRVPPKYVFVSLYLAIGLITGGLCVLWHSLYILATKIIQPKFRLRRYIKNYWIKIYPLLWSSSSESLAVPLSLNLMKRTFPYVPANIRQFAIAGGAYLGINGTLISVYVMGVVLAKVLNVHLSFSQLLTSLPVVFILGYAVPGIPGELAIFAGTMSHVLQVPSQTLPLFMALYLTLQIGLPDSFRTGCNSTDSTLLAIVSSCKLSLPARWTLKKRVSLSRKLWNRNMRIIYGRAAVAFAEFTVILKSIGEHAGS